MDKIAESNFKAIIERCKKRGCMHFTDEQIVAQAIAALGKIPA